MISSDEGREAALALHVEPCLAAARAQDLERLDGRVTLHGQLAQVERFEVSGDEPRRRRADEHAARSRVLLQSRGHVGRVANRCVVHAEIVADLTHDDRPAVEADPHLEAPLEARRQLAAQVTDGALDREGGVSGAPGRVLVRDRRAEQGHDAIARVLIDRALEAMHLGRDHLEATIDDGVDLFWVALLGECAKSREIGEQHRHLPPLALERGPGLEDLVREVLGRVSGLHARRSARSRRRGRVGNQLTSTLVAETTSGKIGMLAGRAHRVQAYAASATELRAGRVLSPASRTAHRPDHTSVLDEAGRGAVARD